MHHGDRNGIAQFDRAGFLNLIICFMPSQPSEAKVRPMSALMPTLAPVILASSTVSPT